MDAMMATRRKRATLCCERHKKTANRLEGSDRISVTDYFDTFRKLKLTRREESFDCAPVHHCHREHCKMQLKRKESDSSRGVELSENPSHERVKEESDDTLSTSSYEYQSANDLNMLQAACLLTADCLGTGLLALPQDVKVLGKVIGLGFLILNLPINLYAGTILANAAQYIEQEPENEHSEEDTTSTTMTTVDRDGIVRVIKDRKAYSSIASSDTNTTDNSSVSQTESPVNQNVSQSPNIATKRENGRVSQEDHPHHDSSTIDYISLTQEIFPCNGHAFRIVLWFYYTNIFLVLGE